MSYPACTQRVFQTPFKPFPSSRPQRVRGRGPGGALWRAGRASLGRPGPEGGARGAGGHVVSGAAADRRADLRPLH